MANAQRRRPSDRRIREVERTGRPLDGRNFGSKSERKRIRKGMVRGYVANRVADAKNGAADRAEFYRNLRLLKLRRRRIAAEMQRLAEMVAGLRREVDRTATRFDVDLRLADEAVGTAREAYSAVYAAAADFHTFARARVYYGAAEAVAA